MVNPARGSVALQAGDTAYTMSFSVNALCELEEAFGLPVQKIGSLFGDGDNIKMTDVRKLVWCGLHDHHPDLTEKQAGEVASLAGIPICMEAVSKAFQLAFPEAPGGTGNPRKAKASSR